MNNKMETNLKKFLADDSDLLSKIISDTKYYHEYDHETMVEVVDNHYNNMIRKIELTQELTKLDVVHNEYVALHKDGVALEALSGVLALEVTDKLNKLMRDEIEHCFSTKGIIIDVSFKFPNFTLDFTVDDGDTKSGQIVNLKLEDILRNMIAYKLQFVDAVISTLTYKTLQAEVPKCGECGITLSINNESGLCENCEADIETKIAMEDAEEKSKEIDNMISKGCPECGGEMDIRPELDYDGEHRILHCKKCNWRRDLTAE